MVNCISLSGTAAAAAVDQMGKCDLAIQTSIERPEIKPVPSERENEHCILFQSLISFSSPFSFIIPFVYGKQKQKNWQWDAKCYTLVAQSFLRVSSRHLFS